MSGRIITVRHGRPDLSREVNVSAREYGDWWARYDASGLAPDEHPPGPLTELASSAETVLSSTLPRAIETARKATGGKRNVPADPMFVEAPLPPPPFPDFIKLRPGQWGVVSRIFWIFGYAPSGVENHLETWKRVGKIADRLESYAQDGDIVLCAHGYLNWMINRSLKRRGWPCVENEGGNKYWSWRIHEPAAANRKLEATAAAE
ncbi:phosphoglycerate mutase family protein [Hyphococcus flavus]|uniref:Phosphoglycerate mutase family protein n=1 Tax=Hyphococcus flavus TaxID=1866326 RepID=A0AAE9ZCZ8_9PROT|nr:histidine phosphatase family protein [Hyphococcus flavus]WDI30197.1 phosphoglycerate mutase family protein [Hyphococcus flavus]